GAALPLARIAWRVLLDGRAVESMGAAHGRTCARLDLSRVPAAPGEFGCFPRRWTGEIPRCRALRRGRRDTGRPAGADRQPIATRGTRCPTHDRRPATSGRARVARSLTTGAVPRVARSR